MLPSEMTPAGNCPNPPEMHSHTTMTTTQYHVYMLALEHRKYYIGLTSNLDTRLAQHFDPHNSESTAWTRKYPPHSLYHVQGPYSDKKEALVKEDQLTLEAMMAYGLPNVRGGSYCAVDLGNEARRALTFIVEKGRKTRQDLCFTCSQHGHYARDCPKRREYLSTKKQTKWNQVDMHSPATDSQVNSSKVFGGPEKEDAHPENSQTTTKGNSSQEDGVLTDANNADTEANNTDQTNGAPKRKRIQCGICEGFGHADQDCANNKELKRASKRRRSGCDRCGRSSHTIDRCFARRTESGIEIQDNNSHVVCYRCGRMGHYSSSCYATFHSRGYRISEQRRSRRPSYYAGSYSQQESSGCTIL